MFLTAFSDELIKIADGEIYNPKKTSSGPGQAAPRPKGRFIGNVFRQGRTGWTKSTPKAEIKAGKGAGLGASLKHGWKRGNQIIGKVSPFGTLNRPLNAKWPSLSKSKNRVIYGQGGPGYIKPPKVVDSETSRRRLHEGTRAMAQKIKASKGDIPIEKFNPVEYKKYKDWKRAYPDKTLNRHGISTDPNAPTEKQRYMKFDRTRTDREAAVKRRAQAVKDRAGRIKAKSQPWRIQGDVRVTSSGAQTQKLKDGYWQWPKPGIRNQSLNAKNRTAAKAKAKADTLKAKKKVKK